MSYLINVKNEWIMHYCTVSLNIWVLLVFVYAVWSLLHTLPCFVCGPSHQDFWPPTFWPPVADLMAWTASSALYISGSSNLSFFSWAPIAMLHPLFPQPWHWWTRLCGYDIISDLIKCNNKQGCESHRFWSVKIRFKFSKFSILSCQILANFITCIPQDPTTLNGLDLYNNWHAILISLP